MDNCYMAEPKSVSIDINALGTQPITIGRAGENLYRSISVDCSSWLQEYPDGQIIFVLQRPDGQTYPVVVSGDNGVYTWTPSEIDTAVSGHGLLQIYMQSGEILGKSKIANIIITKGLSSGETPPDTPDWIVQVLEAAKAVEEAVEHYPYIDETTGDWFVWNVAEGQWEDTGVHAQGPDGVVTPESIEEALGFYPVSPTDLQEAVDSFTDTPLVSDLSVSVDEDSVAFTEQKVNIKTRETSSNIFNLPLANTEDAGAMSPADVLAIQQHTSQIAALEGRTVRLLYTASDSPTAAQIEQFVEDQGYTDPTTWAGIAVVVSGTYHIWHCYSSGEDPVTYTWQDDGVDTVSQFTNSVPGIIQGAASDGKVYAENDGTGSVFGWTAFKTDFQNHVNNTSNPHQVTASQVGAYTKDETDSLLSEKQNALTFDSYPVEDSVNPVKSGGLWALILDIIKRIPLVIKKAFSAGNPVVITDAEAGNADEIKVSVSPKQSATPVIDSTAETDPYVFRKVPVTDRNREYESLVGGSVVWNQQLAMDSAKWYANRVTVSVADGEMSVLSNTNATGTRWAVATSLGTIDNHVFIASGEVKTDGNISAMTFAVHNSSNTIKATIARSESTTYVSGATVAKLATGDWIGLRIPQDTPSGQGGYAKKIMAVDLTSAFGKTIADYIYNLEQNEVGSGVAFFRKYFPKSYYAYTSSPSIQSVSVDEQIVTGKNLFDKDSYSYLNAYFDGNGKIVSNGNNAILYIPCRPNTTYTLQRIRQGDGVSDISCGCFSAIPVANAVADVFEHGTMGTVGTVGSVTITTDGSAQYLALFIGREGYRTTAINSVQIEVGPTATSYASHVATQTISLDHTKLNGIPKLVDGELQYDGDIYPSSGDGTQKYGTLTFDGGADESWTFYSGTPARVAITISDSNVPADERILCNRFLGIAYNDRDFTKADTVWISPPSENLLVVVGNFADLATFKTSLGSNPMSIEYAITPTTLSLTPFNTPITIEDGSTEEMVDYEVGQGNRDVSIPVGHQSYFAKEVPIVGMDSVAVNVTGTNIWNEIWELGRYDTSTGNPVVANDRIRCKNPIMISPSNKYCFVGGSFVVYWYDENDQFISYTTPVPTDNVRTAPNNAHYLRFNMVSAYGTTYNNDISVNYPSTDTDYHRFVGINKWDEQWELGALNTVDGTKTVNNQRIRSKNFIPCLPSTTYYAKKPTLELNIYFYDENQGFLSYVSKTNQTFTTPNNCYFLMFYVGGGNITTYDHDISINCPSSYTDYYPYFKTNYETALSPTLYGGSVNILGGTGAREDTWGHQTITSGTWYADGYFSVSLPRKFGTGNFNVISDSYPTYTDEHSKASNIASLASAHPFHIFINGGSNTIFVSDPRYSSFAEWQAEMGSTVFRYELATPTTSDLTEQTVSMLDGTNIFSTDGDSVSGIYTQSAEGYLNDFGLN